jgi:deoxyribodipyrimidine photo-lyase
VIPDPRRRRVVRDGSPRGSGAYVLYWMQAYRRLDRNHALDHAAALARELRRPLVVYEGLRMDYPWASRRLHRFVLEGMGANAARAAELGLAYWPFVEGPGQPARGLLRRLAAASCAVVTDDHPCFVAPAQTAALARAIDVPLLAVDGDGVLPVSVLGPAASAAAHFRHRVHREFPGAWARRARRVPDVPDEAAPPCPFEAWDPRTLDATLDALPIDPLAPVAVAGGTPRARRALKEFAARRLAGYAEDRSPPAPPGRGHASGLSPWLHFGHLSAQEVAERLLGDDPELDPGARGKREGFWSRDPDACAFLDQLLVWRELGVHWHAHRAKDAARLSTALPRWALDTLGAHLADPRPHLYGAQELELAQTGDEVWNAGQRELVATGHMHNYVRMLWGKKVIEWSKTPAAAYRTLVHLNNRHALDGRDPNSWAGILWCFGLFDRPWPPGRAVFGHVRYMSSASTARKFDLDAYLAWTAALPDPAGVIAGRAQSTSPATNQVPARRSRKTR